MNSKAYKAIIVDDELLARQIVESYLGAYPQIEIVARCANGFEALKAVQEQRPDIMFLDVQMPKITGIELLEVMDNPPAVVFTTAYDEFAIKAFEMNAVDYLMKPFAAERFRKAVDKVLDRLAQNQPVWQPFGALSNESGETELTRIVVKSGANIRVIPVDDILFIEAQEDYVMVHTDKGHYMKSQTMGHYETHLPAAKFVRIHRSYIVHIDRIERLEAYDKETYLAVVASNHKLKVSRTGYKKLKETLKF
ncbi:MAG: LytTR family transcriptional regulator DNA-binding domain-containing protein [Breznakibacter sp.]